MAALSPPPTRCADCSPRTDPSSFDWALAVLAQPTPPTVREILVAYSRNGKEDRELLLSLLAAKTAEDNRIAQQFTLHRSLLHLQYNLPLSPPPEPESSGVGSTYDTYKPAPHPHSHSERHLPSPLAYSHSHSHGHGYAHDHSYPSPTTSSPPNSRSPPSIHHLPPLNLPPAPAPLSTSPTSLGKRPRSPPPAFHHAHAHSHAHHQPQQPSRASPMSLRGILHDGHGGPGALSSSEFDDPRPPKRRNIAPSPSPGHSTSASSAGEHPMMQISPREMGYRPGPVESNVRTSPGSHRLSHERTTSRGEGE